MSIQVSEGKHTSTATYEAANMHLGYEAGAAPVEVASHYSYFIDPLVVSDPAGHTPVEAAEL